MYDCTSGLCEGTGLVYSPDLVLGVRYACVSLVMFVPYDGDNCLFGLVLFSISADIRCVTVVDDLLDKVHVFTCGSGRIVNLGADFYKCLTSTNEW